MQRDERSQPRNGSHRVRTRVCEQDSSTHARAHNTQATHMRTRGPIFYSGTPCLWSQNEVLEEETKIVCDVCLCQLLRDVCACVSIAPRTLVALLVLGQPSWTGPLPRCASSPPETPRGPPAQHPARARKMQGCRGVGAWGRGGAGAWGTWGHEDAGMHGVRWHRGVEVGVDCAWGFGVEWMGSVVCVQGTGGRWQQAAERVRGSHPAYESWRQNVGVECYRKPVHVRGTLADSPRRMQRPGSPCSCWSCFQRWLGWWVGRGRGPPRLLHWSDLVRSTSTPSTFANSLEPLDINAEGQAS